MNIKPSITFAPRYSGDHVSSRAYSAANSAAVYMTRRQRAAVLRRCRAISGDVLRCSLDGRELDIITYCPEAL